MYIHTNKTIVAGHIGPALARTLRLDCKGNVHRLVGLELAGRRKGRQLDRDLGIGIVGVLVLALALLLQFPLFLVDKTDLKGAFGPASLIDLARALARSSHCVVVV